MGISAILKHVMHYLANYNIIRNMFVCKKPTFPDLCKSKDRIKNFLFYI